jgi:hypothetical protein
MNFQFTNLELVATAIVVALFVAAFVLLYVQRHRTTVALHKRFGPEYDRAVTEHGSERKAEKKLLEREKRVESLTLRELEPAERDGFVEQWKGVQMRFVDSPTGAVAEADDLVSAIMLRRGYPVSEFAQRAADISVDHPQVAENYRVAHAIAVRLGKSETSTEELRGAMVHYHTLFDELVKLGTVAHKAAA